MFLFTGARCDFTKHSSGSSKQMFLCPRVTFGHKNRQLLPLLVKVGSSVTEHLLSSWNFHLHPVEPCLILRLIICCMSPLNDSKIKANYLLRCAYSNINQKELGTQRFGNLDFESFLGPEQNYLVTVSMLHHFAQPYRMILRKQKAKKRRKNSPTCFAQKVEELLFNVVKISEPK